MNININNRTNKKVKINPDILLISQSPLLQYYRDGMEIERPVATFLSTAISTIDTKELFDMKFKNYFKPMTFP